MKSDAGRGQLENTLGLMRIKDSRFVRFSVIGGIGFLVDSAVLYAALFFLGLDLYTSRVISYLVAATSTWYLNRHFTFNETKDPGKVRQWMKFLTFNGFGGAANYATYAAGVTFVGLIAEYPIIGVALGSIVGLVFNYNCSRFFVFKTIRAS